MREIEINGCDGLSCPTLNSCESVQRRRRRVNFKINFLKSQEALYGIFYDKLCYIYLLYSSLKHCFYYNYMILK